MFRMFPVIEAFSGIEYIKFAITKALTGSVDDHGKEVLGKGFFGGFLNVSNALKKLKHEFLGEGPIKLGISADNTGTIFDRKRFLYESVVLGQILPIVQFVYGPGVPLLGRMSARQGLISSFLSKGMFQSLKAAQQAGSVLAKGFLFVDNIMMFNIFMGGAAIATEVTAFYNPLQGDDKLNAEFMEEQRKAGLAKEAGHSQNYDSMLRDLPGTLMTFFSFFLGTTAAVFSNEYKQLTKDLNDSILFFVPGGLEAMTAIMEGRRKSWEGRHEIDFNRGLNDARIREAQGERGAVNEYLQRVKRGEGIDKTGFTEEQVAELQEKAGEIEFQREVELENARQNGLDLNRQGCVTGCFAPRVGFFASLFSAIRVLFGASKGTAGFEQIAKEFNDSLSKVLDQKTQERVDNFNKTRQEHGNAVQRLLELQRDPNATPEQIREAKRIEAEKRAEMDKAHQNMSDAYSNTFLLKNLRPGKKKTPAEPKRNF